MVAFIPNLESIFCAQCKEPVFIFDRILVNIDFPAAFMPMLACRMIALLCASGNGKTIPVLCHDSIGSSLDLRANPIKVCRPWAALPLGEPRIELPCRPRAA